MNLGDVRAVQLDVTDDASVDAAVDAVTTAGTGLDVLVNNAGIIGARVSALETRPQDFLACFGVNLLGPVRVTRAFLPLLERSDHPRVVMVSSGVGSLAVTTDPNRLESSVVALVYPASKAALNMVTTQYAKALPAMRVNAVDPGYTHRRQWVHRPPEHRGGRGGDRAAGHHRSGRSDRGLLRHPRHGPVVTAAQPAPQRS